MSLQDPIQQSPSMLGLEDIQRSLLSSSAVPSTTPATVATQEHVLPQADIPIVHTINTNYDPGHSANTFKFWGKSMKERHGPTEKLRADASGAHQPALYTKFAELVSL